MTWLLLSAALLGGVGTTHRMGESGLAVVVAAQVRIRAISAEAILDTADKIETGDGYIARLAADWNGGPLTLGAGWSYRQTSAWSKRVWWARAGVRSGPVWLLASIAPDSPNMEAKAEARVSLRHRWAVVEPRAWVGWHTRAEELGGYAYGLEILVGVAK